MDTQREARMEELRRILLHSDRADIDELRDILADRARLAERVSPIFEERINYLKSNFPQELGKYVDTAIERKLLVSNELLLDIIYPSLGKMVRKFVEQQMELLKDAIQEQIRSATSTESWRRRFRATVLGVDESALLLERVSLSTIEEIFVVQHNSGLLLGVYSRGETVDRDLVAGMFTAIKSFAEDAFAMGREQLETIDYGSYKILIQNSYQYYIAIVVSGVLSSAERELLTNEAVKFANTSLRGTSFDHIDQALQNEISTKLKSHFKPYIQ